jgi:retron-type reverse transcriptase
MGILDWLKNGSGHDMAELARRSGLAVVELETLVPRYRAFEIPKKRGGHRKILAPEDDLKAVQRTLYQRVFKRLRVHPQVTGFRPAFSIASNASVHVGQAVVVRMDIQDFFPATAEKRVQRYFRKIGWNRRVASLLTRLCTHEGGLPQGAPTSPHLANVVNYQLDARLAGLAASCGGVYTRYADDLTFSFYEDQHLYYRAVIQMVPKVIAAYGYQLQPKKLSVRRAHQQQRVTGLVVNEKLALPRKTRRWLRAVDHRIACGAAATLTPQQRAGWAAFEAMVAAQQGDLEAVETRPATTYQPRNPITGERL